MKEFKDDKLELEKTISNLILYFNEKYDVLIEDVNLVYMGNITMGNNESIQDIVVKLDIKL